MFVRSFALGTVLGVCLSILGARLLGASRARQGALDLRAPNVSRASSASHFVDGTMLRLDGRLGHVSVPRSAGGFSTYLLATVAAGELGHVDATSRAPSDVAVVLDRSGSMAGPKLERAIAAASGAVDRLHDGDRLTVVTFDTTARLLLPPTYIDATTRPRSKAVIRTLSAGGDTCISCAIERTTEALEAVPSPPDAVRKMLLISDGEPTIGVRDIAGLRAIAAEAKAHGFAISTLGVDLDYGEKIMAAIAEESNGRHVFVRDPEALDRAFDRELETLETVVGTDAQLLIEPARGVVLEQVFDRAYERRGGVGEHEQWVFSLGAFGAVQDKTVLLKVRVPTDVEGLQAVARVSLSYRDIRARRDARCDGALDVLVGQEGSDPSDLDPFVSLRLERSRTEHALLEANELFARARPAEAQAALSLRQDALKQATPKALSRAAEMGESSAGAAGAADRDVGAQQAALLRAEAAFGAAVRAAPASPSRSSTLSGTGSGAGLADLPSTAAGRAAVKDTQASASDLSF